MGKTDKCSAKPHILSFSPTRLINSRIKRPSCTVPLTKIITKSMFVQRSRSNHTFESIGSVSIISQSSISPISSFTCRSFNRLNHSYCFIDPFIPQKYEIEKRTKFTKVHKVSDAFYLFNLFIYLINAIISYILIVRIGMSLVVINFTSVVKQSQKNKM